MARPAERAAHAAALSALPGMGPSTLRSLLSRWDPVEAWRRVLAGEVQPPAAPRRMGRKVMRWDDAARRVDPPSWWRPLAERGIKVCWPGSPEFPAVLRHDPAPPGVLFWIGDLEALDRPCAAVVGTRAATPEGRAVAFEMGRDLAAAGVCVVSGLALGIDGAAHSGALQARDPVPPAGPGPPPAAPDAAAAPVGVAASGVDVPYPRRHTGLWQRVARCGAVLSETPPGRPAEPWRFPARNRIIAGLCRIVVVVESHASGGSLNTAEAAMERGIEVRAVPGSVRSPASAGTNQLLYDGPGPVRSARDVLDTLGIIRPDNPCACAHPALAPRSRHPAAGEQASPGSPAGSGGPAPAVGVNAPAARAVLEAMGWRPVTMGQILTRTALGIAVAHRALSELEAAGEVESESGWWTRRSR